MTSAPDNVKACCAAAYESGLARMLLGDSFHPGGLELTRRLGELLDLRTGVRVLDVASGKGESAIFLARHFGCEVVGLDFGAGNVEEATRRAEAAGLSELVTFRQGDAESIPFPDAAFDCAVCECAFCTFPDKSAASREFARVLRRPGSIGLSDLTRLGPIPSDLEGVLAWVACIADARPVAEYTAHLENAGFHRMKVEAHDDALLKMARDVQTRLLGLEVMIGLKKLDLPGVDLGQAKQFARSAMKAIQAGVLGYSLIVGELRC